MNSERHIKLDIDQPWRYRARARRDADRIMKFLDLRVRHVSVLESHNHHIHICYTLHTCLTPAEVVIVQLLCGSDPTREKYNFRRVRGLKTVDKYWRTRWNVLYERKL